jgi:2-isopropylmalate synthase
VVVELEGQSAAGQGVATDILEAAGIAYVRALGAAVRRVQVAAREDEDPALAPTP